MKKNIIFEFLYLFLCLIIGLLAMVFFCRTTNSETVFALRIFGNNIEMSVGVMLLFFWLAILLVVSLIRQIKHKFKNHFHNLLMLAVSFSLSYFLLNFISSAQNMKNAFGKEFPAEKITNLNYEIALFSCFQIIIVIVAVKVLVNLIRKAKGTAHNSGFAQ